MLVNLLLTDLIHNRTRTLCGLDQGRIRLEDDDGHYLHVVRVNVNEEWESYADEKKLYSY
jgi:hypothetical protein